MYSKHTEKNSGCIGKMLTLFLHGWWNCRYFFFFFFTESMVEAFHNQKKVGKDGVKKGEALLYSEKAIKIAT